MTLSKLSKLWLALEDDGNTTLNAILKSSDFEEGERLYIPDLSSEASLESAVSDVFTLLTGGSLITYLVLDTFTDIDGTALDAHTPDIDVIGEGWQIFFYYGDGYTIENNKVEQDTAEDGFAYIDVNQANGFTVSADFTKGVDTLNYTPAIFLFASKDGSTLGTDLTDSYTGELVFFDDGVKEFRILRDVVEVADDQPGIVWNDNEEHTFSMTVTADTLPVITLYVDDVEVLQWTEDDAALPGTFVGFGQSVAYYGTPSVDNFECVELS